MKKSKTYNNILSFIAVVLGAVSFFLMLSPVLELTILTQDGLNVVPITDYLVGFDVMFRTPTPTLGLPAFSFAAWLMYILPVVFAVLIFIPNEELEKTKNYLVIRNFVFSGILVIVSVYYFLDIIRVGEYFMRIMLGDARVVDIDYAILSGTYFTTAFNVIFAGFLAFFGFKELQFQKEKINKIGDRK